MLWGNSHNASKVFIKQKKVLRIIENVPQRDTCVPLFKKLEIMTVPCLYIYVCLICVKEELESCVLRQDIHNHETRNKHLINTLSARLKKCANSHVIMKAKLFNKLPKEAWTVNINKFKLIINRWLKEQAFYSVNEFLNCNINTLNF